MKEEHCGPQNSHLGYCEHLHMAVFKIAHDTYSKAYFKEVISLSVNEQRHGVRFYLRKRDLSPFTSFSPQDLALILKANGSSFNSVSGETEPYSLLLLVSSTRTGTGNDMLRRYSACENKTKHHPEKLA